MSDEAQARAETTGETPVVTSEQDVRRVDVDVVQMLGKYRLFAAIGSGGMAEVYLAVAEGRLGVNKLVVIKRLRDDLAEEEQFVQMFLDEAGLAARLSHPNIVHTYEVGEEQGKYFIAMEYLEGQPLSRICSRSIRTGKRVPRALAVRIVMDALSGLHYAHELKDYNGKPLNTIHRDISPHNLFVTYGGTVKVVDFGIAKASSNATHTVAGQLKGKVGYMAPEQALLGAIDRRADLFATGVVLWEALAGKRLFPGATLEALPTIVTADIPRVSSMVDGIDEELDEIVARSMSRNPEGRFQTAEEMRKALEAYARAHGDAVDAADVGKYVCDVFADVREQTRERIERQMEAASSRSRELSISVVRASGVRSPNSVEDGIEVEIGGTPARTGTGPGRTAETLAAAVPSRPRPSLTAKLAGAAVLVLAGVGASWALSRPSRDTHVNATSALSGMAVQPVPTPVVSTTTSTTTSPETLVTIASEPGGAVVTWRGRQVGITPAVLELPVGAQSLMLTKDGYEALAINVEVKPGEPLQKSVKLATIFRPSVVYSPPKRAATAPTAAPSPVPDTRPPAAPVETAPQPATKPTVHIIDDTARTNVRVIQ